jgi:predicted nucleic acid-binding protein
VDAFDADVLIYAIDPAHPLGGRVRALFTDAVPGGEPIGVGSVLLLPEVLSKPQRVGDHKDVAELADLLARLDLREADVAIAQMATTLAAKYRLRAPDAVHLATAVAAGADRFITNNAKDFPLSITEVDVTYPEDLPAPTPG